MDIPSEDSSARSSDAVSAPRRRIDATSAATAAAFGIIGFAIVWYATSAFGPGLSPDSVRYLSVADSLFDGQGFTLYNDQPLITSPPLFSIVLAALRFIGIETVLAARILNALMFALIVVVSDLWLARRFTWRPMADLAVVGILLSFSLLGIAKYVWTETLFALLVLVFLIMLERAARPHTLRQTVLLAVIAALACLTRYIGVVLIPYYWLMLLLSEGSRRLKLNRAVVFTAITSAPLALWLARNYYLSGTLTGNRQGSSIEINQILGQTASSLVQWFYRLSDSAIIAYAIIIAIILTVVAFYWMELGHRKNTDSPGQRLAGPGFAPYYVLWLIALACVIDFDHIGNRLVSPAFVPLVVLIFTVLDRLAEGVRSKGLAVRRIVVGLVCVAWLGSISVSTIEMVTLSVEGGAGGYAAPTWQSSELVSYLRYNPPPGRLYSNGPDVVYLFTGRRARLSPRQSGPSLSGERLGLEEFRALVQSQGSAYLAWFADMGRPYMYSPKDLSEEFNLQPLRRVADGTLYRALPLSEEKGI